jgi:hypothetical protein
MLLALPTMLRAEGSVEGAALLERQGALAEEYRHRTLGKDQFIHVNLKKNTAEVVFYMNRLFLPYTHTLSREGYLALLDAAEILKKAQPGDVTLKAFDSLDPAAQKDMPGLPAQRCAVVFSYLVGSSFTPTEKPGLEDDIQ